MKRVVRLFLIPLAAILFLVSCITIEESYVLKKNGSGSFEFKVDMSQVMSMLKMMEEMQPEGEETKDPMEEIDFEGEIDELEKIEGISNVQVKEDEAAGIFSMSFDFDNYAALNNARHELLDSNQVKHDVLVKKGSSVFFHHIMPDDLDSQGETAEDSLAMAMSAGMLAQFQYKVNFTVEDGASSIVTEAKNNYATSNKETFTLEGTVQELVDNPELLNTEIKF